MHTPLNTHPSVDGGQSTGAIVCESRRFCVTETTLCRLTNRAVALLIHKTNKRAPITAMSVCPRPRRLTQLRMERENAETRVREMEDQLAEFQDEMRKETGNKTVTNAMKPAD